MKEYTEIHSKIISPKNLEIHLINGKREYSNEINQEIVKFWKTAKAKNANVFNGKVFSYINSQIKNQNLIITIMETDFMSYTGTNLNPNFDKSDDEMANVLGISAILHTADDKFLMGKRSKFVSEGQNMWHTIGGNLDSVDINANMLRELKEEANIPKESIKKFLIIGLVKNCRSHRPEMLFYAKTLLTSQQIKKYITTSIDSFEHSEMKFFDKDEFYNLQFSKEITFTAKAIIKLFFKNNKTITEAK